MESSFPAEPIFTYHISLANPMCISMHSIMIQQIWLNGRLFTAQVNYN